VGEMGVQHMIHVWFSITIILAQYLYLGIAFAGLKSPFPELERLETMALSYYQISSTLGGSFSLFVRGSSPPCQENVDYRDINFCIHSPGFVDYDTLVSIMLFQVIHNEFLPQHRAISWARLLGGLLGIIFSIRSIFVAELRFMISYVLVIIVYCFLIAWIYHRETLKLNEKAGFVLNSDTIAIEPDRPRTHLRDIMKSMERYANTSSNYFGLGLSIREVSCGELKTKDKDDDTSSVVSDITFDFSENITHNEIQ
jgi:hypothetical protein